MPAPGAQYESDNIKNPFDERRVNLFTAQEIATLQCRLNKQLGPEYISHRSGAGGSKVAYLEGTKAIALANDVFGFNGWSSSLQQVQVDYVDEHSNGRINLGLSIIVRVTLKDGTYHEDIGYGMIENAKGKGAAFEKAKKEAATDGLKRALRNFGNVLGNCLYDKEYLKKVNTMKVKPIAFNEDRLHRHPDFRPPVVKDEQEMVKTEQRTPVRPTTIARSNVEQADGSAVAVTAEFDDEFGGNFFDGVEISEHQGDEYTFETVAVTEETQGPRGPQRPAPASDTVPPRHTINRVQSMPAIRDQNGSLRPPQQTHQHNNGPPRVANPPNPKAPQTANPQQSSTRSDQNRRAPATVDIHAPPGPPAQPQQQNQPQRATPPQGLPAHGQIATPKANTLNGPNPLPATKQVVGFVTSRAAELVQNSDASMPISNLPAFNPSVESPVPMDKRTPGIDHKRSMKVTRESVGAPALPPPPPVAQQVPQPQQGGNQFRPVGPSNRTNFVNPHHDTSRKIGMPGTHSMSPLANRGAYKPPGPVGGIKRPPLADVSNQSANTNEDGPPEAKKAKLNPDGVENAITSVVGT